MAKSKKRRRKPGEAPTRKDCIRNFCLECMHYQIAEIRRCTATECWLYPYRLGALDKETIEAEREQVKEEKSRKRKEKKEHSHNG